VQAQIAESQKATQAAILESLSITLKSLETVARDLSGLPSVPVETAATPPPRLDLVPKPPAEPVTLPPQAANVKPESRPLVEPPRPEPSIASKAQAPDWQRKLIQIISEKTGYPAEALSLDVELEAGLGIDSIKRVEIFSTLQQQYPGRIEVTPADMGQLKTIRDILRHLNHDQAKPQALPPTVPDPSSPNVQATVLAVVAEKTGYPAEALGLDVDLESGLGIDSIKRVEIFSALQQRLPSIPAFQPEHAGRLRTLGDIIEFIGKPAASPQPDIIRKEAQPNKVRDLEAIPNKRSSTEDLLLTIVAEKTGYPADALQLEANLEADLGIDSIKRVEIFSALQQRLPSLPAFGAEQAGRLRTLAEIVRFLDGEDPSAAPESIPLDRFEVRYEMCAPSGLPLPNLFTAPLVAVLGNPENAIAEAVVQLLKQAGVAAELHRQVPDTCGAAIDLRGLEPANDIDAALQTNNDAFSTAQVLTRCPGGPQLFVTAGTSDEPFSSWRAGAAGVLRTFLREYPAASGKAIAIQTSGRSAGDIAADIASELLFGGSQVDILLAAGARLKPVLKQSDAQPNPSRIGPQSVVIATGGGRGVTAACLLELARTARPRIAILGRTELADEPLEYRHAPDEAALKLLLTRQAGPGANLAAISEKVKQLLAVREIRSTLQALEEAGSAALYVACDVRSQASVARALETVRAKFGPITALIHGSGVIADKRIEDKQPDQFEAVFSTKVHGARTLLEATAHDPVDTICLFSSVAAFFGNPGQCDYAAANEVLNHLADAEAERRGDRSLVRSIGWGPWDGGMVSAPLAAHFKSKGTSLIPLAQGAQAFVREISKPGGPARVLLTALSRGAAFQEQSRDEWTTNIAVGRHTHPFLDGHRIQTQAVIPAVLVAEWFHRAALELMPEAPPLVCQDLRVLRGIPLPEFDRSGHRFELTAAKEGQSIRCELRSREFGLHYTAVLMPSPSAHPGQSIIPALEGNAAAIYGPGSDLFHGREFQVIEQLSLSDDGALACLRTTTRMDWPSEPWLTDPAALDGVLQVIRLWGVKHLGGRSLPTRIGSLEWKQPRSQRDQVFCTVRCRKAGSLSIVADAELIDPQGNLLAVAREIEMHLSPSA
jgi:acyl carrier protein/NAD(P)-dependent dehydrogenase (short-subunit alcohol dehydrogenase family)